MDNRKKIGLLRMLLLGLLTVGTLGYMWLLDLSFIDGLYMTVITVSTVGYQEVGVMTQTSKLFSIVIIFLSIGTVGYIVSTVIRSFVEGDIKEAWRKRNMDNNITKLENHYILCGSGETGLYIIERFQKQNVPFVVIDNDKAVIEELKSLGVQYIEGDATHEEILDRAGVKRARLSSPPCPKTRRTSSPFSPPDR